MSEPRFLCSAAADGRGESATGTASRIDRWLLIEAPGPWEHRALPHTRSLDDAVLLALQQRAKAAHARTLLIRRPGNGVAHTGPRRVFVADSRPGQEVLLTRLVDDADLADLPLPFDADRTGWEPHAVLVGVCTHGSHDVCCAVRGRPVAAALGRSHPEVAWEISHIGGDRFAANALVLPQGHYLGQLTAETAASAVDLLLAGERPDPYYRGRSCWAMPVQAALDATGWQLGITALAALVPTRAERLPSGDWQVVLDVAGRGPVTVRLTQAKGPATSRLTCHAADEQPVPHWDVLSIRRS